jgi:hypothetical protein
MGNIVKLDIDQGGMADLAVREEIFTIEEKMQQAIDGEDFSEIGQDDWVTHIFAPGVYAREMAIKKDSLIVGKLHKTEHINIISQGDISVKTQYGVSRYQAPCSFVSQIGTKRVVYAHVDTVWTTIHPTNETDLKMIEKHVIAKDYTEIDNLLEDKS